MKRSRVAILFFLTLIMGVGVLSSCKKEKQSATESAEEFKSGLSATDTTDVISMCDACMQTLKAGNIDEALQMIQMVDSNLNVSPLDELHERQLRKTFKFFPVVDYRLENIAFNTSGLNDVKYQIEFFEKTDSLDTTPNTIGFMFNPVKKDGQWVLTVKQANQEVVSK